MPKGNCFLLILWGVKLSEAGTHNYKVNPQLICGNKGTTKIHSCESEFSEELSIVYVGIQPTYI